MHPAMYQGSTTLTGDEHSYTISYHNKPLNSYDNYSLSCSLSLQYTMSALGYVNILHMYLKKSTLLCTTISTVKTNSGMHACLDYWSEHEQECYI